MHTIFVMGKYTASQVAVKAEIWVILTLLLLLYVSADALLYPIAFSYRLPDQLSV
jgi:hypothetical protein